MKILTQLLEDDVSGLLDPSDEQGRVERGPGPAAAVVDLHGVLKLQLLEQKIEEFAKIVFNCVYR